MPGLHRTFVAVAFASTIAGCSNGVGTHDAATTEAHLAADERGFAYLETELRVMGRRPELTTFRGADIDDARIEFHDRSFRLCLSSTPVEECFDAPLERFVQREYRSRDALFYCLGRIHEAGRYRNELSICQARRKVTLPVSGREGAVTYPAGKSFVYFQVKAGNVNEHFLVALLAPASAARASPDP